MYYDPTEYSSDSIAPRPPDSCAIAEVVRTHLDDFIRQVADESDRTLPSFAVRELRALGRCGDFLNGFVRLRCGSCRSDRIVPFTCQSRICPSCVARRAADTACWLVDRVLRPEIRWRQVVITFPRALAVGLCFRASLADAVVRLCMRILFEHQRARASRDVVGIARPGGIVWIQRFSDGGGAWFHLHVLLPDGIFRELPDSLSVPFEPQPPPTNQEVHQLAATIARRATRLVTRHTDDGPDNPLLERCASQPARRRGSAKPPSASPRRPHLLASVDGFSVHAATDVPPHQTDALERLLRYFGRPPVPTGRVERQVDGNVVVNLKRARGSVERFVFEPVAFLARLAALIPPPMHNLVRYYGVLAPGSPLRADVLRPPAESTPTRPTAPARPARMPWADSILRVFVKDVLQCPCGGRLRVVAVITKPDVIEAFAAAITLCKQSPARGPPPA